MYKASNAENENYRKDFEVTINELDDEQRRWFYEGLDKCHPQGHHWKNN